MSDQEIITFKQFQATGYDSHVAEEAKKDSSAYHNAEAMSWDGAIRVYINGGLILCKVADGTYFFDDCQGRYSGTLEEMERELYKLAARDAFNMDEPIFD